MHPARPSFEEVLRSIVSSKSKPTSNIGVSHLVGGPASTSLAINSFHSFLFAFWSAPWLASDSPTKTTCDLRAASRSIVFDTAVTASRKPLFGCLDCSEGLTLRYERKIPSV